MTAAEKIAQKRLTLLQLADRNWLITSETLQNLPAPRDTLSIRNKLIFFPP